MSLGIASLHKILKDDTRRRIILLLNKKSSLSYTDLLDSLEVVSTGLLNYHLKVLGDLLTKNETGQYMLSEKGKLAFRLLEEFPEKSNQLQKRKGQKQFWTVAAVSQVVYLISVLTLYYLNYIDSGRLALYIIWFIGGISLAYLGYRVQDRTPAPGSKEEKRELRIAYLLLGGMIGLAHCIFGPTIIILFNSILG
jgi:DNA-binding transcriptional ArsR family regulator